MKFIALNAKRNLLAMYCDPENTGSARVAEKLGFVREGTLRGRLAWHDGTWKDAVFWSLLAREYPETSTARIQMEAFDFLGRAIL